MRAEEEGGEGKEVEDDYVFPVGIFWYDHDHVMIMCVL